MEELKDIFDNGSDIRKAKRALSSNKEFFKKGYQEVVDKAKEEAERKAKEEAERKAANNGNVNRPRKTKSLNAKNGVNKAKETQKAEKVDENLKQNNQLEWVICMNNIKNRAEEIVLKELIYC